MNIDKWFTQNVVFSPPSLQADRLRGSVSECEILLQTFNESLSFLLLSIDTHSLSDTEKQKFYKKMLTMVSQSVCLATYYP